MDWIWYAVALLVVLLLVMMFMFNRGYQHAKPKPIEGIFCPALTHALLGHPDRMIHPLKHELRLDLSDSLLLQTQAQAQTQTQPASQHSHSSELHQLQLLSHNSVFVSSASLAAQVLRDLPRQKGLAAYSSLRLDPLVPDLLTADDDSALSTRFAVLHKAMERLRLPGLYTAFLKDLLAEMDSCAAQKKSIDIKKLFTMLGLDIVCKAAFDFEVGGVSGSELGNTLYETIITINESQASSGLYPLANAREYTKEEVDVALKSWNTFLKTLFEHIRFQAKQYREQNGQLDHENNLSHALIELTTLPKESQSIEELQSLSDKLLLSEIHQIVKHCQESLTSLFMWLTVEFSQNKRARARLQKEIANHQSTKKTMFPDYLEDFIKETLRRHPPCGNMTVRTPKVDYVVKDHVVVPKDVPIHLHMYTLHNTTRTWSKPSVFRPERWQEFGEFPTCPYLSSSKSTGVYDGVGFEPDSLSYFPFSAGSRSCLGKEFVLKTARIFLKQIASKYVLEPVEHPLEDDVGVSMNSVIMPILRESMKLRVARIRSLKDFVKHGVVGLVEDDVRPQDRGWAHES